MRFFDYSAYIDLVERIKQSADSFAVDDLASLNNAMNNFRTYVNAVNDGEQQIRLTQFQFEGQEYRDAVETYDRLRHSAHEAAIADVLLVNRLSKLYGASPLFTGNASERLEVADFCLDVTIELFNNRKL
ncbi:MAG: DUF3232 domain-containing protein [Clostridiales bacterium]|nr:DUF3232 domain-containing protein [Clostridiales bacterium]